MNDFVIINSTTDITLTSGLQFDDFSNPDAHIPDRLRVAPRWTKVKVDVHQGVGTYPAEIAEWNTTKALIAKRIMTISGFTDNADDSTAEDKKKNIQIFEAEEIAKQPKKTRKKLEDVASEE